MKTLLKVLLGIAVVIGGIVAIAMWATSGLPDAANRFLTRIAANDYDGARALTTPDFRLGTSSEELEAFARASGINGYKSASWNSRSIENSVGKLEGTLTVADGGVIPVTMQLVKTDGEWLIQNLRNTDAGVASEDKPAAPAPTEPAAEAPAAPDADGQQQLVAATLAAFAESVAADDFSILHATTARVFQEQVSVEKLREAFAGFVEQEVDLGFIDGMSPTLDAGSGVNAEGVLHLFGSYAEAPSATSFDLQYRFEDGEWRLVEIDVKVR